MLLYNRNKDKRYALFVGGRHDYLQTLRSSPVQTREFGKRATFKISAINFKMKNLLIHNCRGSLSGLEKNFQTQRISEGGEFINSKKQRR